MPDIAHDADDFGRLGVRPIAEDALPDRILVRAVLFHERLVHYRDAWAVDSILPAEWTATQNRNSHGRKVSAAHSGDIGFHTVRIGGLPPSNGVKGCPFGMGCQPKERKDASRTFPGERLASRQQSFAPF